MEIFVKSNFDLTQIFKIETQNHSISIFNATDLLYLFIRDCGNNFNN